jgi:S-adenosylmethionine decarboxylase
MQHCLARIDFRAHDDNVVFNDRKVYNALLAACHEQGLSIVNATKHAFDPQGMTAVVVLAESHVAIHTYPERGQIFMDAFTCGNKNPAHVVAGLAEKLGGSLGYCSLVER